MRTTDTARFIKHETMQVLWAQILKTQWPALEMLGEKSAHHGEIANDRRAGQASLFGSASEPEDDTKAVAATLPDIPEWPESEKLKNEKEALDFYFSSHPLAQHEQDLRRFSTHAVEHIANLDRDCEVIIGGMLTQLRIQTTNQ